MSGSPHRTDHGFAAVWTAVVLFFLVGVAALAVDASGFYQDARAEQTDADLTCLAGVRELPENPNAALSTAVGFAKANWSALSAVTESIAGNVATLDDGNGNVVVITAGSDGDPTLMRIDIQQQSPTSFGKVLGAGDVPISQVAYCQTLGLGSGVLPFGDLPGGMDAHLQDPDSCGTNRGNCERLDIERIPPTGANTTVALNIAYGAERNIVVYGGAERTCSGHSAVDDCNSIDTSTGNNDPQNTAGFLRGGSWGIAPGDGRLETNPYADPAKEWPFAGTTEDGDSLSDIASYTFPAPGAAQPGSYDENINGPFGNNHYITSLNTNGCSSPRIARTPILVWEDEYDAWLADPSAFVPNWPPGTKTMRVVGFHWVFVTQPNDPSDISPGNRLEKIEAIPLQFAPGITCVGPNAPTKPYQPGDPKVVRLVAGP